MSPSWLSWSRVCIKPTLFGLLRTTICVTLAAPLAGSVSPLGAFMCNWTLWGGSHGTLKYLHLLHLCPSLWTWQGLKRSPNIAGRCNVTVHWTCYSCSHLGDKHQHWTHWTHACCRACLWSLRGADTNLGHRSLQGEAADVWVSGVGGR